MIYMHVIGETGGIYGPPITCKWRLGQNDYKSTDSCMETCIYHYVSDDVMLHITEGILLVMNTWVIFSFGLLYTIQ